MGCGGAWLGAATLMAPTARRGVCTLAAARRRTAALFARAHDARRLDERRAAVLLGRLVAAPRALADLRTEGACAWTERRERERGQKGCGCAATLTSSVLGCSGARGMAAHIGRLRALLPRLAAAARAARRAVRGHKARAERGARDEVGRPEGRRWRRARDAEAASAALAREALRRGELRFAEGRAQLDTRVLGHSRRVRHLADARHGRRRRRGLDARRRRREDAQRRREERPRQRGAHHARRAL
eukprot:8459-Prymnesium_polylepis.1